jgi:hypothetical protein
MAIDWLRPFRTCFACNGRSNLSRVEVFDPHQFLYYHQNCLDIVIQNPSANALIIPKALQINYQLQRSQRTVEQMMLFYNQFIQQARTFADATKVLDEVRTSLKEKSPVNNIEKLNKFQKIFGE